jgi:flagellar basal-body rod modification protein FlgD
MAIENTAGVKPSSTQASLGSAANNQLNKEAFMKLLVAELKNQDPMNPMESKEMVAQLSQLTSVEKLQGIESKLDALAGIQSTQSAVQNAALIGKRVEAESTSMRLSSTQSATGSYELLGDASSVQIGIRNAAGELVRQIDLGAQKTGKKNFEWDGTLDNGTRASNGNYFFELTAKNPSGAQVATSTKVAGLVSEVTYENGQPEVIVGGARVSLGDVTTIAQ